MDLVPATAPVAVLVSALVLAMVQSLDSIVFRLLILERDKRLSATAMTRARAGTEAEG